MILSKIGIFAAIWVLVSSENCISVHKYDNWYTEILNSPVKPLNQKDRGPKTPIDKYVFWGNLKNYQHLKVFQNWGMEYEVELKFKVLDFPNAGYHNLVHLTNKNDGGSGALTEVGTRFPAIFISTKKLYFETGINGNGYAKQFDRGTSEDYLVNLSQRKYGDKYFYNITVNGNSLLEGVNLGPESVEKVRLYLSSAPAPSTQQILFHHAKIYQWA